MAEPILLQHFNPPPARGFEEMPEFRPTKPSDNEQVYQTNIFFEESLPGNAVELLSNILYDGLSPTTTHPISIPTAIQISMVTSLIVHPDYTTSLPSIRDNNKPAQLAFHYLHDLFRVVKPSDLPLAEAWKFKMQRQTLARGHRSARRHAGNSPDGYSESGSGDEETNCALAGSEGLFAQVNDLWEAVGWAFTCSVMHKRRWEWYLLLLKVFLDAFESDWRTRVEDGTFEDALIVKMLPVGTENVQVQKILNAVFATGRSEKTTYEEIWEDELDRRRGRRKEKEFDVEKKTILSEMIDEEEDRILEEEAKRLEQEDAREEIRAKSILGAKGGKGKMKEISPSVVERWGGMDAYELRNRFISLLASVCYAGQFVTVDYFTEHLQARVDSFSPSSYILFTGNLLKRNLAFHAVMTEVFIHPHLSQSSPVYTGKKKPSAPKANKKRGVEGMGDELVVGRVSKKASGSPGRKEVVGKSPLQRRRTLSEHISAEVNIDFGNLNLAKFIECYAPFPANDNSPKNNMRIAVLLEVMARLLLYTGELVYSANLEHAIETGISARESKINEEYTRRKRADPDAEECERRMHTAHKCLRYTLHVVKLHSAQVPIHHPASTSRPITPPQSSTPVHSTTDTPMRRERITIGNPTPVKDRNPLPKRAQNVPRLLKLESKKAEANRKVEEGRAKNDAGGKRKTLQDFWGLPKE